MQAFDVPVIKLFACYPIRGAHLRERLFHKPAIVIAANADHFSRHQHICCLTRG